MSLVPAHVELPEDQAMLVEAAGDFARDELYALDRRCDRDESPITEVLPKLAEMGLLNLGIPEELGGVGCSYRAYASILHEIATWSASTAVTISVHSMVGSILSKCAGEPLRSELLSHWADPGNFAAFAVSEAGAGSDSGSVKTKR